MFGARQKIAVLESVLTGHINECNRNYGETKTALTKVEAAVRSAADAAADAARAVEAAALATEKARNKLLWWIVTTAVFGAGALILKIFEVRHLL